MKKLENVPSLILGMQIMSISGYMVARGRKALDGGGIEILGENSGAPDGKDRNIPGLTLTKMGHGRLLPLPTIEIQSQRDDFQPQIA